MTKNNKTLTPEQCLKMRKCANCNGEIFLDAKFCDICATKKRTGSNL